MLPIKIGERLHRKIGRNLYTTVSVYVGTVRYCKSLNLSLYRNEDAIRQVEEECCKFYIDNGKIPSTFWKQIALKNPKLRC
jgi:hypothetical protein